MPDSDNTPADNGKADGTAAGRAGHTPGPWFYGIAYSPEDGPVPFDYESPGYYDNTGIMSECGETVVGCGEYNVFGGKTDAEWQANARLIAAAPDLLEALNAAVISLEWWKTNEPGSFGNIEAGRLEAARAAIAKARGEA